MPNHHVEVVRRVFAAPRIHLIDHETALAVAAAMNAELLLAMASVSCGQLTSRAPFMERMFSSVGGEVG